VTLFIDIDQERAGVRAIEGTDGVDGAGTVIQLSPMEGQGADGGGFSPIRKTKPIFRVADLVCIFSTLILLPLRKRKTSSRPGIGLLIQPWSGRQ